MTVPVGPEPQLCESMSMTKNVTNFFYSSSYSSVINAFEASPMSASSFPLFSSSSAELYSVEELSIKAFDYLQHLGFCTSSVFSDLVSGEQLIAMIQWLE